MPSLPTAPSLVKRSLAVAGVLLLAAGSASADSWTTVQGTTFEGKLRQVYGDVAVLVRENGSTILPVNSLDDASLLKVADFLAVPPPAPVSWDRSASKVAKSLANRLQILRDRKFAPFQPGSRPEPEFYLVYFGAYWCGPCRRFSPRLIETYHRLKALAPDRFEVIFVSDDTDAGEQFKYASEISMPWPVLKYSAVGRVPVLDQWRGGGIPCLVVLTREGDLLYHSYRGKEYLGADDPLEKFAKLLEVTQDGTRPARQPGRHRLAIAQQLRAANGGRLPPQPYLISIDPRRLQALTVPRLTVQLTIDAQGHVAGAEFTPQLGAAVDDMLRREAENWLFLPAIDNGRTRESNIQLPLELNKG